VEENGMADEARGSGGAIQLPPPGIPVTESIIRQWFRRAYGREPADWEVGDIMEGIAQRDASSPREGPSPILDGWQMWPAPRHER
jgi:hypothetical protein